TGVATDRTADTQKVDVASADKHGVRWHAYEDILAVRDVQYRVHSLDAVTPAGASSAPPHAPAGKAGADSRTTSRPGSPRDVCPCSSHRSRQHYHPASRRYTASALR